MPHVNADDGSILHYELTGPPEAVGTVVLVQALGYSARYWGGLPARLAGDPRGPWRVLTLDHRGTGGSTSGSTLYGLASMADDVHCCMAHANCGPAIIVGTSLGGIIAQKLAARHPERAAGLLLLATTAGWPAGRLPSLVAASQLVRLGSARGDERMRLATKLFLPAAQSHKHGELLARMNAAFADRNSKSTMLVQLLAAALHTSGRWLDRISCPTLAIAGTDDALLSPKNTLVIGKRIAGAVSELRTGTGHAFPLPDDQALGDAIARVARMPPPPPPPTPVTSRARVWIRRSLPYAIALLVLAVLAQRYSVDRVLQEMKAGNATPLFPLALFGSFASILFVGASDSLVYRALFGAASPPWLDVLRAKAASTLLFVLNFALGQATYGAWIARRAGLGVRPGAGLLVYVLTSETCALCLCALIAVAVGSPDVPVALPATVATIALAVIALILVAPVAPWSRIGRRAGVLQLLLRLPQFGIISMAGAFAARAFGLDVPLPVLLAYMPIILLVGSLPANILGFGAVQGAWLLLSSWERPERILAFSLLWQLAWGLGLVIRGLPFLARLVREIQGGKPLQSSRASATMKIGDRSEQDL